MRVCIYSFMYACLCILYYFRVEGISFLFGIKIFYECIVYDGVSRTKECCSSQNTFH